MNSEAMNTGPGPCLKKSYTQPVLRVYGGIQDLTKASANPGTNADTRGATMDSRTS